jgi:hypothetical protein
MYVEDDSGKYDYCVTSLTINDNFNTCPDVGGFGNVAGVILTETGDSVTGVEVTLNTFSPEYPRNTFTEENGSYLFSSNPYYYDYELSNSRDYDYTSGVTTLDIVLIQKHILGLESLDSPYKLIASDINNDCKITAVDLLQLRKLILGIYENDALPNNESWRFVADKYDFVDPSRPCNFEEVKLLENFQEDEMNEDFTGVKIGDVNGTVVANQFHPKAQVRSNDKLNLSIDEVSVKKGETYELSFYGDNFNDVFGFQFSFTFNTELLSFAGLKSEALNTEEQNFGLTRVKEGVITTSWNNPEGLSLDADEKLFTIVFKATRSGSIMNSIAINSSVTPAEAYFGNLNEVHDVYLSSRSSESTYVFDLFQNNPNPFSKKTEIGFVIPEAKQTSLTIFNAIGEVLYEYDEYLQAGNHIVTIDRKSLNGVGVLYYRLVSGENSKLNKMIIID